SSRRGATDPNTLAAGPVAQRIARPWPVDEYRPRPRDTSRAARAARSSVDGLLAVGVVAAISRGVGFFSGVLRLFGGVRGLLGGVGQVLATGHVAIGAHRLAGDLGRRIGGGVGRLGGGLRRLRGGHVAG